MVSGRSRPLFTQLNQYHVILEVEPQFRDHPSDLRDF
jgi:hypothetical protein